MSEFEKRLSKLERPLVKNNDGDFGRNIEENGTRYLNDEGRRLGVFTEDRPADQPLTKSEWSAVVSRHQAELLSRSQPSGWSEENDD